MYLCVTRIEGKIRGTRSNRRKVVVENQKFRQKTVNKLNADTELEKLCAITGRFCFRDL